MATLVLTAVGTAVGGPIGGMIGSIVGQHVDRTILFPPKARHGPRLGDLAVQTSSYGTAIPRLFGRMRVAGCVIWATDLVETRSTTGRKGQPKQVSYDYSASFAVALSARPIRSVGRIWADGKLLRGAAGDFKTETEFRLHPGDEDQEVDPLIAAAEGADQAPAMRGIAYAVFENLQLRDFGNRIPSLTFEVEADEGPTTLGAIAETLAEGAIAAGATPELVGYAASGDSIRSAIEALAELVPLSLAAGDDRLLLRVVPSLSPEPIAAAELRRRPEIVRRAAVAVPDEVSLTYYDPARDFQSGLQRAASFGAAGGHRRADRRAAAAAVGADAAKAFAEFRLASLRAGRTSAKLSLPPARLGLRPGDTLRIAGQSGVWRVERWSWSESGLDLELVKIAPVALPWSLAAEPGRNVGETDLAHGATLLRLIELPLGDSPGTKPLVMVAAAGATAGWRRARLAFSLDGGAGWEDAGTTAAPAVLGTAIDVLTEAPSTLIDTRGVVDVELQHEGMWLEHASDAALGDGANLALIGNELMQFGKAQWLGGRRFRLSRLLRGRRGTEWASSQHQAGEPFLLIERETLAILELGAGAAGAELQVTAAGLGDAGEPAAAQLTIAGESLRPPAPAHLRAVRLGNGDIEIKWVRRSRLGWAWPNGSGTPLGEERESYQLAIEGNGFRRTVETGEPGYLYTAAQQAADGAGGPLTIEVAQAGTHAVSRGASTLFE